MDDHTFCRLLLKHARADAKTAGVKIPKLFPWVTKGIGPNPWGEVRDDKGNMLYSNDVCCCFEAKANCVTRLMAEHEKKRDEKGKNSS
jgi:hypothetical protein